MAVAEVAARMDAGVVAVYEAAPQQLAEASAQSAVWEWVASAAALEPAAADLHQQGPARLEPHRSAEGLLLLPAATVAAGPAAASADSSESL